jgi:hypothetical protein
VEDADEGADDVVRMGVGAQLAAVDGVLDEAAKGAVDGAAGAFDHAGGTAGDGVHGGQDEGFGGDVVNEDDHPGPEGLERGEGGGEVLAGGGELFDLVVEDGFDEVVAGGEVAVESSGAHFGAAGDVVERSVRAVLGEGFTGDLQDSLAVPLGVDSGPAHGGWWGGAAGHTEFSQKFMQPETISVYLISGDGLRFTAEASIQHLARLVAAVPAHMRETGLCGFLLRELRDLLGRNW